MFNDQLKRSQYWPEVERFFSSLPPRLFEQAVLLKNNLAIRYSGTGQLKDIFSRRSDYPLLDLHLWLLDDLHVADDEERRAIERHVLVGMVLAVAAGYAHACLLDPASFFDNRLIFLEQALTRQAVVHFARLFPGDSIFWDHYRACWDDYAEASLAELQASPAQPASLWSLARKLAPAKIPIAAVALKTGRPDILPQLLAMVERLNLIFRVRQDILAIRYDLSRGRSGYAIARTLAEAGLERQPVAPEQVLGAMLLSGSIEQICRESLDHLAAGRTMARGLHLPRFVACFDLAEELLGGLMDLFSPKVAPAGGRPDSAAARQDQLFLASYVDPLPQAVIMAERYLLADLTFRESWEVQRGGLFDLPEVTARAFPAGLIVELLCRQGQHLPAQVDEIFRILRDNRFQYYDSLPVALPDADDLGLLLRLFPYSAQPEAHRALLQEPLAWLVRSILPSGEIPVWFTPPEAPPPGAEAFPVLVCGNSCATTETNLLLGLIDYDWAGFQAIIERSALSLLDRFLANGLAASFYYLPPYIVWAGFKLVTGLAARPISAVLQQKLQAASTMWLNHLEEETRRPGLTPQAAAFWSLACCTHDQAQRLFDPGWITALLKHQRYDGSWDDEPLYLIPDRNQSAWYSSRSVTTAFCYHALKTYQACRQKIHDRTEIP